MVSGPSGSMHTFLVKMRAKPLVVFVSSRSMLCAEFGHQGLLSFANLVYCGEGHVFGRGSMEGWKGDM